MKPQDQRRLLEAAKAYVDSVEKRLPSARALRIQESEDFKNLQRIVKEVEV